MVVGEASIHNIMGGMMSTGGVRLHNHKRKLKQRYDGCEVNFANADGAIIFVLGSTLSRSSAKVLTVKFN